ncbi:DNA/RNA non-specific endonuclease [Gloeobacter morelensis MG652769]|uniref:Endonuclease n=2 Tax=Gloeobacter TaxID=33071 RepID=A0ABY3PTM4_9CYAN|nr:DNA/RNA non-specific endonuclease [Gloeobacter morelensis MG652769]
MVLLSVVLGSCAPAKKQRLRCTDFTSSQQVIDAYRSGAKYLDSDGNGYACEDKFNVYVGKRDTVAVVPPAAKTGTAIEHLLLGNPSRATATPGSVNNYLLLKPQYALSYNAAKGIPNWASWQLNRAWLGRTDRQNDFRPDESLPVGLYRVNPAEYTGSGYDRGHLVPSADRTVSGVDNSATFLMTNMTPQSPDLNRGPWEKLESYCRELVGAGKELYIVAGASGELGRIGGGKVSVPARHWKVIVVLDAPGAGLAAVTGRTRVIAVDIPNGPRIKDAGWREFRVNVDRIEAATGYNLLSGVPENIQALLESRLDNR